MASKAQNYFLIALFGALSFIMLFQSYTLRLPEDAYFLVVTIFILAMTFSILFSREIVAAVGIFLFSIVIRLMYYVSTGFAVLPYGDPYSQYSVFQLFAQTSRVSIFPSPSFLNFLTRIPHQYSQWPGFEAFSVSLSRVTNIPVFWIALVMPFILYSIWFLASYALVRKIFSARSSLSSSGSFLSLLSIGVASAIPAFELPPIFKYDFLAAILLLTFILLLLYPFESQILQKSALMLTLVAAIVVTHSLTALFMVLFVALVGGFFVLRIVASQLPRIGKRYFSLASYKGYIPFPKLIVFVLASVALWWTFYATFVQTYGGKSTPAILGSFSIGFLDPSRIGAGKVSVLGTLTARWLVDILRYRDNILLGLVVVGALILVIRPSILRGRVLSTVILVALGIVTIVTESFKTLNFGDRAFLTFAPIIACFVIVPVALLASRKVGVAKACGVLILLFFLFTVAVGFWGSSYAPTFLYSKTASAYVFGEHPTNWQSVSSFVNYSPSGGSATTPSCILTNEVFVTSLVVPIQELSLTYQFTDIRPRSGCIAIIYDTLLHFNSSYIGQPYAQYAPTSTLPGFSDQAFSNTLSNESDLVFDGGNATVYYMP